jgi:putative inorganic carbon (hco3(-)) transporter
VWLMAGCIGFFGLKGGALFIITAGHHQFEGPPGTAIQDRNHLAAAMLMAVPLMNYLRLQSADRWIRCGLVGAMGLTILAVIGTYSRGGFIGLLAVAAFLWWRSRQKVVTLVLALLIAAPLPYFVPEQWTARMRTIETADKEDDSFKSRLLSWQTYLQAALDRPLTGAGIYALNKAEVFFTYMPYESGIDIKNDKARAAHSIYFQVLGELGFVAFFVYLLLVTITWLSAQRVIAHSRRHIDLLWAGDLARMIQVALVAFLVSGAALSTAFYDLYFMLISLSSALHAIVRNRAAVPAHGAMTVPHVGTTGIPGHLSERSGPARQLRPG